MLLKHWYKPVCPMARWRVRCLLKAPPSIPQWRAPVARSSLTSSSSSLSPSWVCSAADSSPLGGSTLHHRGAQASLLLVRSFDTPTTRTHAKPHIQKYSLISAAHTHAEPYIQHRSSRSIKSMRLSFSPYQ